MKELLTQIKNCAVDGIVNAVAIQDDKSKELFLSILSKAEIGLTNYCNKSKQQYNDNINCCRTYERIDDDSKHAMYLVSFCFSYYEHTCLYPNYSQDKAFEVASKTIGVKKHTLKNSRDWFDGHNDSLRKGWWQAPLPEQMQKFKDTYEEMNKKDVINEAKKILGIEK